MPDVRAVHLAQLIEDAVGVGEVDPGPAVERAFGDDVGLGLELDALGFQLLAQLIQFAQLGKSRQRLFGFFFVQFLKGEADMHDDVIPHGGIVDQRQRDLLAHAAQVDDGVAGGAQLLDTSGNGETHL